MSDFNVYVNLEKRTRCIRWVAFHLLVSVPGIRDRLAVLDEAPTKAYASALQWRKCKEWRHG